MGDSVDVYTEKRNTRYVVGEIRSVPSGDVSVLGPRPRSSVTLVTCYPFYFVGSASLRYIVHASTKYPINLNVFGHQSPLKQEVQVPDSAKEMLATLAAKSPKNLSAGKQ